MLPSPDKRGLQKKCFWPIWGEIVLPFGPKMDMNGLAMARYGPRLSQDGATGHMNLLEAYLALYKPILKKKSKNVKNYSTEAPHM